MYLMNGPITVWFRIYTLPDMKLPVIPYRKYQPLILAHTISVLKKKKLLLSFVDTVKHKVIYISCTCQFDINFLVDIG